VGTEHPVIRSVVGLLALAAVLGTAAQAWPAPPTSLALPQAAPASPNNSPSPSAPAAPNAPNAPAAPSLSGPLSAPLSAPLSGPLGGSQLGGPQLGPGAGPQAAPQSESNKQNAAPAEQKENKGASLRAAYDEAFEATMDHPSDPDVLVKFAELAIEFGDMEGAISALERLLLIDDDQPEVKLELGVLYFRLGSKEAARMYLDAAAKSASASPETKEKAEQYLKADGAK
jgi:tetratricopeptide (TPR) repeat protein